MILFVVNVESKRPIVEPCSQTACAGNFPLHRNGVSYRCRSCVRDVSAKGRSMRPVDVGRSKGEWAGGILRLHWLSVIPHLQLYPIARRVELLLISLASPEKLTTNLLVAPAGTVKLTDAPGNALSVVAVVVVGALETFTRTPTFALPLQKLSSANALCPNHRSARVTPMATRYIESLPSFRRGLKRPRLSTVSGYCHKSGTIRRH